MFQAYSSPAFEEKYTYTGSDLGHRWTRAQTSFRLWAPTARSATVRLYKSGTPGAEDLLQIVPMKPDAAGTWIAAAPGNWNGVYYTYQVLLDSGVAESIDPYAVAAGINGQRGMIVDLSATNPVGWERDKCPVNLKNYTDAVIYETHVRDISADASSGIRGRGKFLGLTETGTATESGHSTGLDYIRGLGVTHVHLMPVFDYGSVDEAKPGRSYNWGYDPVNYNVPEGSYATDARNGAVRIRELKEAVLALHQNGLGVIMDVVYNHVYHTWEFSVNTLVPGYFSREDEWGRLSNGSYCGNDTASERAMVRKFIVDSVNFWAEEYHMDGFRFDLVGLIDVDTMREILATVSQKHPNLIFYGEGWTLPTVPTKPDIPLAVQGNACLLPGFAFFNDTIRDTLRGSIFDCRSPGYVTGAEVPAEELLDCFRGRTAWSCQPNQIVNYVSCHDNHTLHDRVAEAMPYASEAEIARRCRFAAAFSLLSVGIPFFQAGEELLRRKQNRSGKYIGNSYRSPNSVNAIRWNTLDDPEVDKTLRYYRGLLAIRKRHALFRTASPEEALQRISLAPESSERCTVFRLENEAEVILAAFNANEWDTTISLPYGSWTVCAAPDRADADGLWQAEGCASIPPFCAFVAVQEKAR